MTPAEQDFAVRIALLEQTTAGIKGELHNINANISKLIWVVVAGIGAAFVQFVLRGGLSV